MLIGCTWGNDDDKPDQQSLMELFEGKDELMFIDSSPDGVKIFGGDESLVYCELLIEKNGKVRFNSYAYNFCNFGGTFRIENGDINIFLESVSGVFWTKGEPTSIKFPTLNLIRARNGVQLVRKDGERHLKEHWNVYEGVEIFPLILAPPARAAKQAEQGADDQLPARVESKSE